MFFFCCNNGSQRSHIFKNSPDCILEHTRTIFDTRVFRMQSCNVLNDIQINSLVSGHVLKLWLFFPLEYSTTQPENGTCCFGATWINLWDFGEREKKQSQPQKDM